MSEWNVDFFYEAYETRNVSIFPGSPYMYTDIVKSKKICSLERLKICDCGGDFLATIYFKEFEKMTNAVIVEGYGLTETTSLTHYNINKKFRRIGSIGKAVSGAKCKIVDREGNKVKPGTWGILWIKGPMVSPGYVNGLINKKWFNTGDIATVKKHYYYIAGRQSDLINLKENVDITRIIENYIYEKYMCDKVFIEFIGQKNYIIEMKIYIEIRQNYSKTDIINDLEVKFNSIKLIDLIILEKLAKTATGKVQRNLLLDIKKESK